MSASPQFPAPEPRESHEGTLLVVGATGHVGTHAVRALAGGSRPVRALVRESTDASWLKAIGVEIAHGDLRHPDSLRAALANVSTVVCAVTAVHRFMAGDRAIRIRDVDRAGVRNLVEAADRAGVERFVFVSLPRLYLSTGCQLVAAAMEAEDRAVRSRMTTTVVRADPYAETWLSPEAGFDPMKGAARIYGRGDRPIRFTSTVDIGAAVARLTAANAPPGDVELAGPEAMTFLEVTAYAETVTGRPIRRQHIPTPVLRLGSTLLRSARPELASVMALAWALAAATSRVDASAFTALGIDPMPVSDYIRSRYGDVPRSAVVS